jgi:hypothetical protein
MIVIKGIRIYSIYSALFLCSSIVSERVWATINERSYENNRNPRAISFTIFFVWALGLLMCILIYYFAYLMTVVFIIALICLFDGIVSLNLNLNF